MPPLKARHTWTHDQRLTLHLLHDTSLTLDRHQRTQTFNTIYADQLRRSGYPDGFPVGTLNSQYREHSKLNSPSPPSSLVAIWRPILQAPATEAEATKRDLIREQILKVAKSLVTTARGSRDGPVDAKKRKRACAPADRAGRRYETDVGRAHEGLQLIDSDSEDVSPSLASGWTKRTASKFPQWRLDSRHVAYAIDEEESDFDAVVKRPLKRSRITRFSLECDDQPPNATPNRPKRTTSQFSKWTFDSSHAVAADKDADLDSDFLPESSPGLSRFSRSSPAVVVPGMSERRDHIAKEKRGPTSVMKPKKPNLKKSTPKKPTAMKTPPSIVRRKEIATVEYHRPNGTIMLTPAEFAATKEPYVTPSEAEAHPPLAGLLFRYE